MATAILTWNANSESDLAGYRVYRALGAAALVQLASLAKVTTYTDATIPNVDQDVSYALTAFDTANNESLKSATVTNTVNAVPPGAPTGLSVVLQ